MSIAQSATISETLLHDIILLVLAFALASLCVTVVSGSRVRDNLNYDASYYWDKVFSESSESVSAILLSCTRLATDLGSHLLAIRSTLCVVFEDQEDENGELVRKQQRYFELVSQKEEVESVSNLSFQRCLRGQCYHWFLKDLVQSVRAELQLIIEEILLLCLGGTEMTSSPLQAYVPDIGSISSVIRSFGEDLQDLLSKEMFSTTPVDGGQCRNSSVGCTTTIATSQCVPVGEVQALLRAVARRTNTAMSQLHLMQLVVEQDLFREKWVGYDHAFSNTLIKHKFHPDLGVHRNEIIPNLLQQLMFSTNVNGHSMYDKTLDSEVLRYLEVGVLNGDNAMMVVNWFESLMSNEHCIHSQCNEKDTSSFGTLRNLRLLLIDPFENATAAYFEQAAPWPIDRQKQKSRADLVRQRFARYSNEDEVNIHSVSGAGSTPPINVEIWPVTSREAVRISVSKRNAAAGLQDDLFDLIFIDGDHSYAETLFDLMSWSKFVRRGGILAVHDYSTDCVNCEYEVVQAMEDFLSSLALRSNLDVQSSSPVIHTSPDVLAWVYM